MVTGREVQVAVIGPEADIGQAPSAWPGAAASWLASKCDFMPGVVHEARVFVGTADQVAAVRGFVRALLGGHPALDDAVLVASELAANAIAHTASGHAGGAFGVHLARLSAEHVAVLVTDQGGPTEPSVRAADLGSESGRGLDVVTALSSTFSVPGEGEQRSVLAVIPPIDSIAAEETP
jgi:serine/threonine-protein kinase RsbW